MVTPPSLSAAYALAGRMDEGSARPCTEACAARSCPKNERHDPVRFRDQTSAVRLRDAPRAPRSRPASGGEACFALATERRLWRRPKATPVGALSAQMRRPRPRAATGVFRRLRTSPLRKHGHSRRRGERINSTPVHRFSPRVMSVSRTARQTLMSTSCSASSTIISLGRNPALASTASAVRPASQPEKSARPPEASRHARASNEMRRIRSSRIDRTRPGRPAPPRRRHAATALLRLPPSSRAPGSTTRRLGVAEARLHVAKLRVVGRP